MKRFFCFFCLAGCVLAGLTSCGYIDYYLLPPPEDTAQELFEAGQDAMNDKNYGTAAEYFIQVKDRYPFSPYTPRAEIGLGDALYLNEKYAEAAEAYKDFEALHPRHTELPYILYQIGLSSYKRNTALDRPQNYLQEGVDYLTRLVESFPNSQYVPEAQNYIVACRRRMAEHEFYVARVYWNNERYKAAWERYTYVEKNFSDLPDVVEYAKQQGQVAYVRYQEIRSDYERRRQEGSWKDYFNWL